MTKRLSDREVLFKAAFMLTNEAEVLAGLDYPTAKDLRRKMRMIARRLCEIAAKKRQKCAL